MRSLIVTDLLSYVSSILLWQWFGWRKRVVSVGAENITSKGTVQSVFKTVNVFCVHNFWFQIVPWIHCSTSEEVFSKVCIGQCFLKLVVVTPGWSLVIQCERGGTIVEAVCILVYLNKIASKSTIAHNGDIAEAVKAGTVQFRKKAPNLAWWLPKTSSSILSAAPCICLQFSEFATCWLCTLSWRNCASMITKQNAL